MHHTQIPILAIALALTTACGGSTKVKSYAESAEGLEALVNDLAAAVEDGKDKQASAISASLELPDAAAFFSKTFGDEIGARLTAEYEPQRGNFAKLPKLMEIQRSGRGRTVISVERYTDAADGAVTGVQKLALEAMVAPTALYSLRMTEPGKTSGFHLYSFAYVDGGFRMLGKMKKVSAKPAGSRELQALGELRVRDAQAFLKTGKLPGDPK